MANTICCGQSGVSGVGDTRCCGRPVFLARLGGWHDFVRSHDSLITRNKGQKEF